MLKERRKRTCVRIVPLWIAQGDLVAARQLAVHPVTQRGQEWLAWHLIISFDLGRAHTDAPVAHRSDRTLRRCVRASMVPNLVKIDLPENLLGGIDHFHVARS